MAAEATIINVNTTLCAVIILFTIGCTGYTLRKLRNSGQKQTYLAYVIILMQLSLIMNLIFSVYCLVLFDYQADVYSHKEQLAGMFTLPIVGYSLWSLAGWLLTFKYW